MRISELSRRVEVAPDLLRAWERRYGLLTPRRTAQNARLYSTIDEARVRLMKRYLGEGIAAAQAAELTLSARVAINAGSESRIAEDERRRATAAIRAALDRFDETSAQLALQSVMGAHSATCVIRDLVIPYMAEIGERWEAEHVTIAQEHFASNFFASRLLALARGWDRGLGPRALLACAPGDQHTIGLLAFGIALHQLGWRITYLGADTPFGMVASAAEQIKPELVVLASSISGAAPSSELRETISSRWPLALAGAGVNREEAQRAGGAHLAADPITAAHEVTTSQLTVRCRNGRRR